MSTEKPTRLSKKALEMNDQTKVDGGLLGVGLDNRDGHKRVTTGNDFLLVGGSDETHERMQDLVIRMNEKLKRKGKRYRDLEVPEFEDLVKGSLD